MDQSIDCNQCIHCLLGRCKSLSRGHDHRGIDCPTAASARDADRRGIRSVPADRFIYRAEDGAVARATYPALAPRILKRAVAR